MKDECNKDKWSFDKEFLKSVIVDGKRKLESKILSRSELKSIRCDIETFERFIRGDYESFDNEYSKKRLPKNIDKLKDYILRRMAKQYKILGEDLIRWVIELSESEVFEENFCLAAQQTKLSFEEIVSLTIKNYEKNSFKFLPYAKAIILDDTIKQIQLVDSCGSYCHHDSITSNTYILFDYTDPSCIFNHEVQHAIEGLLGYPTNVLYYELGPIFYELLFNDELYKLNDSLNEEDFAFRINDACYLLDSLYGYFQVLLSFAQKNFDISTNEFLDTFLIIEEINPNLLEDYLREEIASDEKIEDMNYLFSFLKAIELREEKINSNKQQMDILEPHIKRRSFYFQIPQNGFRLYERYIEEMNHKVRKKLR